MRVARPSAVSCATTLALLYLVQRWICSGTGINLWQRQQRSHAPFPPVDFSHSEEPNLKHVELKTSQSGRLDTTLRNNVLRRCRNDKGQLSIADLESSQKSVLYKHLLVSDRFKFIYCYVPKVACSNWKKTYLLMHGAIKSISEVPHLDHKQGFKRLSDFSDDEIQKRLKSYFKFAFVRHPLERALSAYRNKFGEMEAFYSKVGKTIAEKYHTHQENHPGKVPGDDVAYEDFLRYVSDYKNPLQLDEHFMPMHLLCQPCAIKYDFIGTYDSINVQSEEILRKVGAPSTVHFPLQQSWYKPTSSNYVHYYHSLLPAKVVDNFYRTYRGDFELFGFGPLNVTLKNSNTADTVG